MAAAGAHPVSVLVVDNCPDTVDSFAYLLTLDGHEARTARTAADALALLTDWQPDAALLDLLMPDADGFQLARRLRERPAGCPLLVAVTGCDTPEVRERARAAGFAHFLVKPVDSTELLAILQGHAGRPAVGTPGERSPVGA